MRVRKGRMHGSFERISRAPSLPGGIDVKLQEQLRGNVEEPGQFPDVRLAGLPFSGQHLGGNAPGAEDRKQVGLTEVALVHQEPDHPMRRYLGELDLVVIVLDEAFEQREEGQFLGR